MLFPEWSTQLRAIFSDLDDTLTSHGMLHASTVSYLEKLKTAGYWLVIVSGRPAGWADCLLRLFPLDAIIFENGAGLMRKRKNKISIELLAKDLKFEAQKIKLHEFFEELKQEIPTLKLASDQPYRLCDYALDYAEEPPFLDEAQVQFIMKRLEGRKDLMGKLSSIHINYWVGNHTKVSATRHLLDADGKEKQISLSQAVFFGDSPNDEPLFDFFPHSVGVANIQRFLPLMKSKPSFLTSKEGGAGFEEFAAHLLRSR